MEKSPQIRELEKCIAAGNLSGMEAAVTALQKNWQSLSLLEQQEALKLEAIFLSLKQLRAEING